jgi:hypothetical protein
MDSCLSLYYFYVGHCVVYPSSIYTSDYPFSISKLFLDDNLVTQGRMRYPFLLTTESSNYKP